MTTEDANKAAYLRLLAASNTLDADVIAATIDEVFDPDVTSGTPLPVADVTGPRRSRRCTGGCTAPTPTCR